MKRISLYLIVSLLPLNGAAQIPIPKIAVPSDTVKVDSVRADSLVKDTLQTDSIAADSVPSVNYAAYVCPPYDSSIFYKSGLYYDREGDTYIITRKHLDNIYAVNLCDVLEHIPEIIVARNSFLGTLSDIKFPGKERYLDDKPVVITVDGMEIRRLDADRIYLNEISVNDIERIVIEKGRGGLSGGEIRIDITTRDAHVVPARTEVLWEMGPFDMNVLQFSIMRRMGERSGLFLSVEKNYMFEGLGTLSGGAGSYSHPGMILDIYRAFLDRDDSLYVGEGLRFENFSRNWDIKMNTFLVPGMNLCAGYAFLHDHQDDYREHPNPGEAEFLNFTSWHSREKWYLRGRSIRFTNLEISANVFTEKRRLEYVEDMLKFDSAAFRQGMDTYGGKGQVNFKQGPWDASLLVEAGMDHVEGESCSATVRRERVASSASMHLDSMAVPIRITARSNILRDSRVRSNGKINTRALLSPGISLNARLPFNIDWDAGYGCERRYPSLSMTYIDNPKLNYHAREPDFKRVKTYRLTTGLHVEIKPLRPGFRISDIFTKDPPVFTTAKDSNFNTVWIMTQDSVGYLRRVEQIYYLEFVSRYILNSLTLNIAHSSRDSKRYPLPFWTTQIRNVFTFRKTFIKGNLFTRISLATCYRPQFVYGIEFYDLSADAEQLKLYDFMTFDLESAFTIKSFNFFCRLQNLTNQVVSFEPGYHLPGPLLRWGIDWHFGG